MQRILLLLAALLAGRVASVTPPPIDLNNEAVKQLMDIEKYEAMSYQERYELAQVLVNELVHPNLTEEQTEWVRDKLAGAILGLDFTNE